MLAGIASSLRSRAFETNGLVAAGGIGAGCAAVLGAGGAAVTDAGCVAVIGAAGVAAGAAGASVRFSVDVSCSM